MTAPVEQRSVVITLAIVLWILASLAVIIVIRQCPVSPGEDRMVATIIRGLFYLAFVGIQIAAAAFVMFMIRRCHSSRRDPPVRRADSLHQRHPGM